MTPSDSKPLTAPGDFVAGRLVPLVFCCVGVMLAWMLVKSQSAGVSASADGMCGANCESVLVSRWAYFPPLSADATGGSVGEVDRGVSGIHVHVALLGFYYFTFLGVWFLFIGHSSPLIRGWGWVPSALLMMGCAAGIFLTCVMAMSGHWCPVCLTTHILNFGLAALVLGSRRGFSLATAGESPGGVVNGPSASLVGAVVLVGVFSCLGGRMLLERGGNSPNVSGAATAPSIDLASQNDTGDGNSAVDEAALGASEDAPMTLVMFTDFQCGPCAQFEQSLLTDLVPKFNGNLRVVLKQYPLSTDCNPYRDTNVHPGACEAGYLAEAARRQGGIADMLAIRPLVQGHDASYSSQEIQQIANVLGINGAELEQDFQSQSVRDRMRADIELGHELGVAGTPTIYLNGRPVNYTERMSGAFWQSMVAVAQKARATGQMAQIPVAAPRSANPPNAASNPLAVGKVVDLSGPTVSGTELDLKSLRGRPVLLEFWASWCHFCQGEMPMVLKTYTNNHADGLQVVGVSLDNKKEDLEKFIGDHKMAWPQIFIDQDGSRGWDSPLVKSFEVQSIPTIILLDANGRVMKTNLRGNDIAASVAQILGKPIPPPDPIAAVVPTQRRVSTARKIQPGDMLDLGGPTVAGPDLKLSQFRGKPVLVEFWASWCDHCVTEMPNVAAVNKKYGSQGLQVVGISLDKQKSELVKTISDAGIDWPQVFFDRDGSRGWENPLAQKFGVTGIPFIVLVGADGKVQKTGLRGQAIDDAVGVALSGSGK